MRHLAVIVVACNSSSPGADIDAPIDVGGLCGGISDASPIPFLQADYAACGCCAQGVTACIDITVDPMGFVTDVVPSATNPPEAGVFACVHARVVGRCEANLAGTMARTFCITGT